MEFQFQSHPHKFFDQHKTAQCCGSIEQKFHSLHCKCMARHSGTKCLKPARNRFISVCYIVISQLFKATFNISVSGKWMNFIFKIRQIIAGISQNSQFPKFIISISGGFLKFGPFVRATSHNNFSWKLTNLL